MKIINKTSALLASIMILLSVNISEARLGSGSHQAAAQMHKRLEESPSTENDAEFLGLPNEMDPLQTGEESLPVESENFSLPEGSDTDPLYVSNGTDQEQQQGEESLPVESDTDPLDVPIGTNEEQQQGEESLPLESDVPSETDQEPLEYDEALANLLALVREQEEQGVEGFFKLDPAYTEAPNTQPTAAPSAQPQVDDSAGMGTIAPTSADFDETPSPTPTEPNLGTFAPSTSGSKTLSEDSKFPSFVFDDDDNNDLIDPFASESTTKGNAPTAAPTATAAPSANPIPVSRTLRGSI